MSVSAEGYRRGKESIEALAGLDLTIEDGGRLVIQGPTGGGKSTLLQMLGALDRPTAGQIVLDGLDLATVSRLTRVRAESIGFVFQSFNLDESMRDEAMELLEGLWKEHGLTFVMVTHDSALAKRAPRVATIRRGRVTVTENA
ncbi:ATP-binding cassette domain-containing protein [Streptomyces sp. H34-S4]|uniref:ATP-binding cassette domain-containing protein n=1 Tax=Streptomyces sp. H34-S4 TaxID=2996463 RepID=UPI00226DB652|nr:ATP-binding cassette domain-containing protein [Streptomyces sp. H34-S4]MCY0932779.1 ATP-binding cassette domain-containing protein [Streptomyces sp. H34-S4]